MKNIHPRSVALATAALSAMAQQAHAGAQIDIDQSLVNEDLSETIQRAMSASDHLKKSRDDYAPLLGKSLTLDGKPSEINMENLLALRQARKGDSADAKGVTDINGVCYGNCHSACHGSRSWR